MCLMCQTKEKDHRQGRPLSAKTGGGIEKDWPKRPSDHQLQEVLKKTDRAIILVAEAVRVPAHLAPSGSLKAKQSSWLTLTGAELPQTTTTTTKISCVNAHRVA